MLTRLSTRGRVVIPKAVREPLSLTAGDTLHIRVDSGTIVLEPISPEDAVTALYGMCAGLDLLAALESEHRQEIESEEDEQP